MGDKLQIVSFLWGNWCGEWGEEYVHRMAGMLHRHVSRPFDFFVYTDKDYRPYEHEGFTWESMPDFLWDMPGNMKKLFVYNPEWFTGRTILIDLDMILVGCLEPFLDYEGPWCGPGNLLHRHGGLAGGGLVSFDDTYREWLWDRAWKFRNDFYGKERYFYRRYLQVEDDPAIWQDIVGKEAIVSYKWHIAKTGMPLQCRVVHFHGRPRPHEVSDKDFIRKHWRRL